jgi:hypothetical protein
MSYQLGNYERRDTLCYKINGGGESSYVDPYATIRPSHGTGFNGKGAPTKEDYGAARKTTAQSPYVDPYSNVHSSRGTGYNGRGAATKENLKKFDASVKAKKQQDEDDDDMFATSNAPEPSGKNIWSAPPQKKISKKVVSPGWEDEVAAQTRGRSGSAGSVKHSKSRSFEL